MNREIKFRVWDKYKKQMYPISSIDYDIFSQEIRIIAIGHKNGMCTSYNKNHNSEKCDITALELMQYTGLHDKNGKEIYEGDIVLLDCYYYEEPAFDGEFKIIYDDINGMWLLVDLENKDRGFTFGEIRSCYKAEFEVIGNVFEKGILLNDSEKSKKN